MNHPDLIARGHIETPMGELIAVATDKGLAGLWYDAGPRLDAVPRDEHHRHIDAARRWMAAYWAGRDTSRITIELDLHGTLFQRAVWQELLKIPAGHTRSYGEVAERVGNGAVPRATGTAVGRNPVIIIVPCHRVIGANGSLTGFAAGLHRKEHLLQHEGVLLT
jgi:methylated-DNA-[protein]-cysteine S-methyltransferase